jgi:hypothetical protein
MIRTTAWFVAGLGLALVASPVAASEVSDAEPDHGQGLNSAEQELDEDLGVLHASLSGEGESGNGSSATSRPGRSKIVGGILLAVVAAPVLLVGGGALIYAGVFSSSWALYALGGFVGMAAVPCVVAGAVLINKGKRLRHGSETVQHGSRIARARPQLTVLADSRGAPSGLGLALAF